MAILERLPLFAGCTHRDLERLAEAATPMVFHRGDKLCVAGGDSPDCFVVVDGTASITVGQIRIDEVGAIDVVGERGPITDRPRAATVTATTDMFTYAIGRDSIRELMATSPTAADAMRDELLRRYG